MQLAAAAPILFLFASGAFADDWSKRWTVGDKAELHVDVYDGRIEVRPSSGNVIEAHVTTEGWRIRPAEVTICEWQTGNRIELKVRVPKHRLQIDFQPRWVHVELRVPADTYSDLRSGDGSIQIHNVRGSIRAFTGDGSVEADGVEGSLEARTGDGHIKIRGKLDRLDLNTGDGRIEADLRPGSKMSTNWKVTTGDGHVTLRLPRELNATLDAQTGDGSVTVDLPITVEGKRRAHGMRGKINGGGEVLMIRTGDGAIRLEKS